MTQTDREKARTTMVAEQDELAAHAARLAALLAFPRAVREYTVGLARFRESSRLANKLVCYDTRWGRVGRLPSLRGDRDCVPGAGVPPQRPPHAHGAAR